MSNLRSYCRLTKSFLSPFLRALFLNIEGMGNLPGEGMVIIAKHQSFLDAPILACALPRPPRFTSAEFLFSHPIYSLGLKWVGSIPVGGNSSTSGLIKIVKALKNGEIVAIFPQGGINRKRFYRGAFFAAEKAKVPVIPVVVENPEENCNKRIRVSKIKVKFYQPLYPPSFRDKELMKSFEKEVIQKLKIEME